MANNHETLTGLFTDIADAIREKTGGTETIVADNFPTEIAAIDTQENLDAELATQDDLISKITTALEGKAGSSGGGSGDKAVSVAITTADTAGYRVTATYFDEDGNGQVTYTEDSNKTINIKALHGIVYFVSNAALTLTVSGEYTVKGNLYRFTSDGGAFSLALKEV